MEATARTAQERNRFWWEALPMTYADWDASDRVHLKYVDDFLKINPFLQGFDFGRFKDRRVVDIGCGAGPAAILFARVEADTTAIDLTTNATRLMTANAARHRVKVKVCQMDAEALALRSGAFDFAFAWGSLHHSSRPTVAFAEPARILAPGGGALVMVYNKQSARYLLEGPLLAVVARKGSYSRALAPEGAELFHGWLLSAALQRQGTGGRVRGSRSYT